MIATLSYMNPIKVKGQAMRPYDNYIPYYTAVRPLTCPQHTSCPPPTHHMAGHERDCASSVLSIMALAMAVGNYANIRRRFKDNMTIIRQPHIMLRLSGLTNHQDSQMRGNMPRL